MTERLLSIRGCDPLLFRDGRPFADEIGALTAESLPLPLPGTLAGLLRTRLGEAAGWTWDKANSDKALQVSVAGPLLARNGEVVFPTPADTLLHGDEKNPEVMTLRPRALPSGGGCDLPGGLLPLEITGDIKPLSGFHYWPQKTMMDWLLGQAKTPPPKITGLPTETRTHVKMDGVKGIGEEGKLFHAEFRAFEEHHWKNAEQTRHHKWSLLARMTTEEAVSVEGVTPFGGERRLAQIEKAPPESWPDAGKLKAALAGTKQVRLVLATPALFAGGWKPGWLNDDLIGERYGVSLKLVSAAVGRREPVSGWDFRKWEGQKPGPKAVRWMVPAGAVYFFEVTGGDAAALAERGWLQSVSDAKQDQRDGYGLALWGLW